MAFLSFGGILFRGGGGNADENIHPDKLQLLAAHIDLHRIHILDLTCIPRILGG